MKLPEDSRNHVLLPGHLVLDVVLRNPVRPLLHEDHCGVLLLLRYLAEFGRSFGLQDLLLPTSQYHLRIGIRHFLFRDENFCCIDSFDISFGSVILL